ncbi:MAG: META domain-containing protein, partial [Elusimicrobia bacterium]|nr:META domain-containing protein [Elusimicrobiota bacterium]
INGSAIEFMPAASTMMAAFIEPEGLREHEFFRLLANAHNWEIRQDHLWLHTTNSENESVVMIFAPTEG